MAIYFVGDIQGCYSALAKGLALINFDPACDELWPVGDLVARGEDSLATLKLLISLGNAVKPVLGNHDLHLLAIHAGLRQAKSKDNLANLLASDELPFYAHWLSQQPLLRQLPDQNVYVSHAGLSPQWTIKQAIKHARFAEQKLQGDNREKWLSRMYGDSPASWADVTNKTERFRYTINSFTRMRYCFADGSLEFDCKLPPKQAPKKLKPWYQINSENHQHTQWIFGHWASLMGNCPHQNIYALDNGCVWGGTLNFLRWHDKQLFKVRVIKSH